MVTITGFLFIIILSFPGYCWKFPFSSKDTTSRSVTPSASNEIFDWFFSESYAHDGYAYAYPSSSSVTIAKGVAHKGNYSLKFDLDPADYSGGSVCLNNKVYNLKPVVQKGALQFWVKGAPGAQKAWVALVDEETGDKHKTVVRLSIDWFGQITGDWTLISIPLKHFGDRGVYWDDKEQREVENDFDWEHVAEFRIEVKKGDNTSFKIWVDDIVLVKFLR